MLRIWIVGAIAASLAGCASVEPGEDRLGTAASALGQGPASLVVQHSGKCAEISGSLVTQQACTGLSAQQWSFQSVTGGFQIVSALSPTQCLNVAGASTVAGDPVAASTCSPGGVPGEIWNLVAVANDFNLVATPSQDCMDVRGGSTLNGAPIIQWACNNQTNQLWAVQSTTPDLDGSGDAIDDGAGDVGVGLEPDAGIEGGTEAANADATMPMAESDAGLVALVAEHSAKCVEATGGFATQQTCTGSTAQGWSFRAVTGGFQVVSAIGSNECLNVAGASATAGQPVVVSACTAGGVPGEIWQEQAAGSDVNLVAVHSQLCMDVHGASVADGASVIQWTCNGQGNQLWALRSNAPSPDAASDSIEGASVAATDEVGTSADAGVDATPSDGGITFPLLVNVNSGKCVGVSGALAIQQTCTGAFAQQWSFTAVAGGFQIVSAVGSNQCLNIAGASTTAGQPLAVSACTTGGVPGEIWQEQAVGNDVNLVAVHSQLCMDVHGGSGADGASIIQWTCNGQANQLWALRAIPSTDPADGGQWSGLITLPSIPVAAAMLPTGKVLTWASWEPDSFGGEDLPRTFTALFDPQTFTATSTVVTQTSHDMFCPGTAMLGGGQVLINGGGPVVANTSLYDGVTDSWTADALMNQPRWYDVSVTLPDGRVFTLGGNRRSGLDGRGEIWAPGSGWITVPGAVMTPILTGDPTNRSEEHPRLFVAPNGKVFVPGPTPNMQWYDLAGSGSIAPAGARGDDTFSQNDVTVLFDVGKLLKAGGNTNYDMTNASTTPSSPNAYVIDINGGGLAAVQKVAPLAHARAYANGVLLPDGRILVVGGLDNGKAFTDTGAVLTPELFDPATLTWRDLSPMGVSRPYHSVALLMPDARVFVGGGGLCGTGCAANHSDAQIFSPPYLFQGGRPQVSGAPSSATYGSAFTVTTAGAVTAFSWVRMSSVTHTVNTDQRWLSARASSTAGGSFSVTAPANANVAPPGYYMLFALNGGVPSVAQIVRIGP